MVIGVKKCLKTNADLENAELQMSITLLITHTFVNFLAVHDTKRLKFKVQKFQSHSVFRVEELYIV